jgi:hypothetical protein
MCRLLKIIPAIGLVVCASHAQAGWITTEELIFIPGQTVITTTINKRATGQAVLTGPLGSLQDPVPPGGGRAQVLGQGGSISTATVNLQTQRTSHGWIVPSDSGLSGAGTEADIEESITSAVTQTPTSFIVRITRKHDPAQLTGAYFGPGVEGQLNYNMSVLELNSGTTVFNSTSVFTQNSPNTVIDNTGLLTWARLPGFFTGVEEIGNVGGVQNLFSNNYWFLQPTTVQFDFPVTLLAGQALNLEFAFMDSSSGFATSGTTGFGFSSAIPEPSSFALLILGAGMGMLFPFGRRIS